MTVVTESKILKKQNWTMWTFILALSTAMFSGYQYENNKYEKIIEAINKSHLDNSVTQNQVEFNTKRIDKLEAREDRTELRQDKVEAMTYVNSK